MQNLKYIVLLVACSVPLAYASTQPEYKLEPSFRLRYHQVTTDQPPLSDATALTLKGRLRPSISWGRWSAMVEADYVMAINEDKYNSVTVTRATPPIPDPAGFDWNQFFLAYDSQNDWQLALGRQAIHFNNERHVSAIEFWQNSQSFDAATFVYNNNINWQFQYSYASKVHRIFGADAKSALPAEDIRYNSGKERPASELGLHDIDSHLVNVSYIGETGFEATGYFYDINNKQAWSLSTYTYGLRLGDQFKLGKIKYRYQLEYAQQQNAHNNLYKDHLTDYRLLEFEAQYKSHALTFSQEVLGEDGLASFVTPLGFNHKFQGWADIFTGYLSGVGLEDNYLSYRGRYKKLRLRVIYHHFNGQSANVNIGQELDVELTWRFAKKWRVQLVYADYQTQDGLESRPNSQYDLTSMFASVSYGF